jgi:hypothetical protein
MDKIMKKFGFTTLLILTLCCSQSTWAVLSSSYYDGRVYYNDTDEGIAGWIDFAVFDTEHDQFSSEYQDNGIEMPGEGRYIYAYQIFQHSSSDSDVTEFSILDMGGNLLGESLINGTSAQDDGDGGIEPLSSDTEGVWEWSFEGGSGYISADEQSYLLVFSSEQNLTKGTYEIKGAGLAIPDPVHAPEPTSIAILSLGIVMLTSRHRKKSRV